MIPNAHMSIPLTLDGIMSSFESCKPTWEEYETLPWVELTADTPWDPYLSDFSSHEEDLHASVAGGVSHSNDGISSPFFLSNQQVATIETYWQVMSFSFEMDDHADQLISHITVMPYDLDGNGMSSHVYLEVYSDQTRAVCSLLMMEQQSVLTPEVLSKQWHIRLQTAKNMIKVTTQTGIWNVLAPGKCNVC